MVLCHGWQWNALNKTCKEKQNTWDSTPAGWKKSPWRQPLFQNVINPKDNDWVSTCCFSGVIHSREQIKKVIGLPAEKSSLVWPATCWQNWYTIFGLPAPSARPVICQLVDHQTKLDFSAGMPITFLISCSWSDYLGFFSRVIIFLSLLNLSHVRS